MEKFKERRGGGGGVGKYSHRHLNLPPLLKINEMVRLVAEAEIGKLKEVSGRNSKLPVLSRPKRDFRWGA